MFTPTLTDLERDALKLLIKFGWNQGIGLADYQAARRLVIKALELADDRPVDVEKRKAELNAFISR